MSSLLGYTAKWRNQPRHSHLLLWYFLIQKKAKRRSMVSLLHTWKHHSSPKHFIQYLGKTALHRIAALHMARLEISSLLRVLQITTQVRLDISACHIPVQRNEADRILLRSSRKPQLLQIRGYCWWSSPSVNTHGNGCPVPVVPQQSRNFNSSFPIFQVACSSNSLVTL